MCIPICLFTTYFFASIWHLTMFGYVSRYVVSIYLVEVLKYSVEELRKSSELTKDSKYTLSDVMFQLRKLEFIVILDLPLTLVQPFLRANVLIRQGIVNISRRIG